MGHTQFYYLAFVYSLAGRNPKVRQLDAVSIKSLLLANFKTLFGDFAASIGFDLLVFRSNDKCGVIRCHGTSAVKLRASMTLPADFDGEIVSFMVLKASPFLVALLANSRTYEHKNYFTAKRKLLLESYSEDEEDMDTDGS